MTNDLDISLAEGHGHRSNLTVTVGKRAKVVGTTSSEGFLVLFEILQTEQIKKQCIFSKSVILVIRGTV